MIVLVIIQYHMNEEEVKEALVELVLVHTYGFTVDPCYDCGDDCCICSDNMFGSYVLRSPCGHILHRECMLQNVIIRGKCCECEYNYIKMCKEKPVIPVFDKSMFVIDENYLDQLYEAYDRELYIGEA